MCFFDMPFSPLQLSKHVLVREMAWLNLSILCTFADAHHLPSSSLVRKFGLPRLLVDGGEATNRSHRMRGIRSRLGLGKLALANLRRLTSEHRNSLLETTSTQQAQSPSGGWAVKTMTGGATKGLQQWRYS